MYSSDLDYSCRVSAQTLPLSKARPTQHFEKDLVTSKEVRFPVRMETLLLPVTATHTFGC